MAQLNIDLGAVDFQKPMERMPKGWYPAVMQDSDVVATASKNGFRLECSYLIIDGPHKGRKVVKSYNIDNPSAEAVRISLGEIKTAKVCMGLGPAPLADSQELHNHPLQILLTEPKDSDYNDIKGYKSMAGEDADKMGSAMPPMAHVPAAGFAQPPAPPYAPVDPTAGWQRSPDNVWKLNPATNAWEPNTVAAPPPPPAAPAAAAPPAWSPQSAPAAAAAPPAYAPPPPAGGSAAAPPAWVPQQGPSAPAWSPAK